MKTAEAKSVKESPAVVQAVEDGRVAAPDVEVDVSSYKYRDALIQKLDDENPAFRHFYEHPETVDGETELAKQRRMLMRQRGREFVKDEDGTILNHGGDPVVREAREKWESKLIREGEESEEKTRETIGMDDMEETKFAKAKTPKGQAKRGQ